MPESVLVVEDDPNVREMMIAIVENEGHTAIPVESGAEALQLLRNGLNPCLILLDGMMPAQHGREFRAEQSADPHLSSIPTIVVSAPKTIDLDKLTTVLKSHCINNHRFV